MKCYPKSEKLKRSIYIALPDSITRLVSVCILSIFISSCAGLTYNKTHNDFSVHCTAIEDVMILSPNVDVYLVSLKGSKVPLKPEAKQITAELIGLIKQELSHRGYSAALLDYNEKPIINSDQLFTDVAINQLYHRISKEFGKPVKANEHHNYECNLGEEAKNVASFANADALVFSNFKAWKRTGGSIATELAVKALLAVAGGVSAAQPTAGETLQVALVDGNTGDVLWINETFEAFFRPIPPDFSRTNLENLVNVLFKDFPE